MSLAASKLFSIKGAFYLKIGIASPGKGVFLCGSSRAKYNTLTPGRRAAEADCGSKGLHLTTCRAAPSALIPVYL